MHAQVGSPRAYTVSNGHRDEILTRHWIIKYCTLPCNRERKMSGIAHRLTILLPDDTNAKPTTTTTTSSSSHLWYSILSSMVCVLREQTTNESSSPHFTKNTHDTTSTVYLTSISILNHAISHSTLHTVLDLVQSSSTLSSKSSSTTFNGSGFDSR